MAGLPAITLPLMKVRGLPVGLDLMGRGDWELIEVAEKVIENAL
jgi:Asp-tRNA(Asn)/Glu-tRNA(Gln) amidotransferase A subunit family amidase